jgi:Domain of unknown function (DUF4440)
MLFVVRARELQPGGRDEQPVSGEDRATTLEASRAFRERGGRLDHLAFPETQAQRFGDVVVLYGRYEVVIHSDGAERTMRGRLTEMFIRRNGKVVAPRLASRPLRLGI